MKNKTDTVPTVREVTLLKRDTCTMKLGQSQRLATAKNKHSDVIESDRDRARGCGLDQG